MRIFLLLVAICWGGALLAQERCATVNYIHTKQQAGSAEARAIKEAETFLKKPGQKQIYEEALIRIPVVIHVLYNNASQNITDAQIRSGIDALNRDFRRRNADTVNTPSRFRNLAADVQIEFSLATADPSGKATTGIVRKHSARTLWLSDDRMKFSSQGGDDAWDRKNYLNIWIVDLAGASGYASVPGSTAETDGVVIHYRAFGTISTAPPFTLGRTAVHEVGHWLGLKHIWGDAQCGDDLVEDTPTQSFFTQGCPSGFRSSCNNGALGDMYMNYMDYTDDACMNLFTAGQRARMRSLFAEGGPRASLLASRGLNAPWVAEASLPVTASLYPNPAQSEVTVQVDRHCLGQKLGLYNSQGQLMREEVIVSLQQTINIAALRAGIYFLKGKDFSQKFIKL